MKFLKKSLGQNFLIDKNIIKKIINLTDIKNKNLIEIGPGNGALTDEILKKKPKTLILIEKDNYFAAELKKKYSNEKCVSIFNIDFLKFNIEKKIHSNSIVFGNLPYNISSQILVKLIKLKWPPKYNDLILMFQKELGEKIISNFESKNYGRLSVLTNLRLSPQGKFFVSANSFFPKPKITSMIIHFKPKKDNSKIRDIKNLEEITNIFFSNKRKMINKSIKKILNKEKILKLTNLNLNNRPTDIKPETYYKITELFEKG